MAIFNNYFDITRGYKPKVFWFMLCFSWVFYNFCSAMTRARVRWELYTGPFWFRSSLHMSKCFRFCNRCAHHFHVGTSGKVKVMLHHFSTCFPSLSGHVPVFSFPKESGATLKLLPGLQSSPAITPLLGPKRGSPSSPLTSRDLSARTGG